MWNRRVFRKHSASGGMLGSAREGKKTHSLCKLRFGTIKFFEIFFSFFGFCPPKKTSPEKKLFWILPIILLLVHCEIAAASILQYLIGKDSKLQKTFFMLKEANITYQLWNPPIPKMWCPSSLVSVICFLTQNHHSITTKNRIGGIRLKYWGQSMMMIWSSKVARSS